MRGGLALVLVVAMALGSLIVATGPADGASKSFDLYGHNVTGWGSTSGGETMPGPTMTVDQGDSVTMHLFSEDGLPHQFHIDYDGDGAADAGEPLSPVFSGSITYTFTASTIGAFTYRCTVHPSMMFGTWVTQEVTVHDVAVTSVVADPTSVEPGQPVTITVVVENQGTAQETTTVTAFAGSITVGSNPITLGAGITDAVVLTWDTTGVPPGNYEIRGEASQVPGETDTSDNSLTDGTVTVQQLPPPGGDLKATLVGRGAWPGFHHFSVPRRGSIQTFFGKIGNIGPDAVSAKVVFTVYDGAGNAVGGTESNVATIPLGGDAVVFGEWRAGTGRFHVVAQCWFDSNGDGTFDSFDSNTKEFSFAVVL